jgi:hypothetical protein
MPASSGQIAHTPSVSNRPPIKLFVVSIVAALIGLLVALSFGYADHAPRPHGVRIAVTAPVRELSGMSRALNASQPGGFVLVPSASAASTLEDVRGQRAAGGFVLPQSGPATIITAPASGASQAEAIDAAMTHVAGAFGRGVRSVDAVPLPANDSAGLSGFVLELCLLIPSVIGSIGFFLFGMRHRVWWRVAGAVLFAVLVGGAGVLALDAVFGALTGPSLSLLAVAVFGALTFVLTIGALQALVGLPGTAVGALVLVFTGNAISGATVPVAFLPAGFRQIAPWLPNNAVVRATRDVVYFSGHDMGHAMLVLGLWSGAALAVFAGVDLLHHLVRRWMPHQLSPGHPVTASALLKRLSGGLGAAISEARGVPDSADDAAESAATAKHEEMELVA